MPPEPSQVAGTPFVPPARYTPWSRGIYEVAPALKAFGTDFGNGALDRCLVQIDSDFPKFRAEKLAAIVERATKYRATDRLRPDVAAAAWRLIARHLASEWPSFFSLDESALRCHLTDSQVLSGDLDALALEIPDDVALIQVGDDGREWTAYLNLCSPSHWAAEAKIGRSFFETHRPIPGFDRVNEVAASLVDAMVHKGPFVRFVWGVESDDRLNHHPEPPPGVDPDAWDGRDFAGGQFWVRTERQVIWGLPEVNAALFLIRVGHVPSEVVLMNDRLRRALLAAIESMDDAALAYKGLDRDGARLLKLLKRGPF